MNLNKENFEKEISGKILVDFYADWCGPCKSLSPVLESISDKIKIGKVNVDENSELASKYNVMSIPCLILFENSKEIKRSVGLISKEELINFIS